MKWYLLLPFASVLIGLLSSCKNEENPVPGRTAAPAGPVTFAQDVAPVMYRECSPCHRPGQAAPFPLLTYADAKKRARQIAEVTRSRFMPIWPPERGHQEYADQRVLTDAQISMFASWAKNGAPEGDPASAPPPPTWTAGWQLGRPDLVVEMPETYTLPASGKDVYRNFVLPLRLPADRYVNAVEFHPNNRAVHHTFIYLDPSSGGRDRDARDPEPGFPGMDLPEGVGSPDGYFLSWQPGKSPSREPEGLGWTLPKGSDLILQMHMPVTGKPEKIRPALGLYFMDRPPARQPVKIGLSSIDIDVPAGRKDYKVTDSFTLPVDVQAMAVLAHAHYLARDVKGYAVLPDGSETMLLHIPHWDFNWQGDYRFASPVFLPSGSRLVMEFTYDNSAGNVRNPNRPPKRVTYGPETRDEMGELYLQLLAPTPGDREKLVKAYAAQSVRRAVDYRVMQVKLHPRDSMSHALLGKAYFIDRQLPRAMAEFETALKLDPKNDLAHYLMGVVYRMNNRSDAALEAFEKAVRYNPRYGRAYGNIGLIYLERNQADRAEDAFRKALRIDPNDAIALESLRDLQKARGAAPP